MEFLTSIAMFTVSLLGIGLVLAANYYIWRFVIKKILVTLKIYELLLEFAIERNRKKDREVYTPQIKQGGGVDER